MKSLASVFLALALVLVTTPLHSAPAYGTEGTNAVVAVEKVESELYDEETPLEALVGDLDSMSFWKKTILGTRKVSGTIFVLLMIWMLLLTYLDSRHPRKASQEPLVSIVIPCYNDAETVQSTIASVFKAYQPENIDLIVVNDMSTDDSLARIREMEGRHQFRVIDNQENKGKARSLNDIIPLARAEFVLCLDADTVLNRAALSDMLARMRSDDRLGAVSAPYRPANRGFLPLMQGIEYSMLLLTQGAHNISSAMALWGGCMMVRKTAFEDVRGFRLDAMTEDVDMAFRMNQRKWRVEQSFRPVKSVVPKSLRGWIRQKLRWTAGGAQCYIRHVSVWIRNPIQIFFILSYSFLIASSVFDFFDGVDLVGSAGLIWDGQSSVWRNICNLNAAFGADLLHRFGSVVLCCGLSCVYILPFIRRLRDVPRLLLVIPFSMIYFPAYIVVSLFGSAIGIRSLIVPKKSDVRAWKT